MKRTNAVRLVVLRGLERVEKNPDLACARSDQDTVRGTEAASFQPEPDLVARLDRLVEVIHARLPTVTVHRSDATRVAIVLGLEVMEPELGLAGTPRRPRAAVGKA